MSRKISCSVEILTLNSAKTLERCLESVQDFDDIIVLDGNSTDATVEIAKKHGARVYPQYEGNEKNIRIENFAEVRNKGIAQAKYEWFTFVDSDEYLSKEVVNEMKEIIERGEHNTCFAFRRPRKFVLNGKVIEYATTYPSYQLRFFHHPHTRGFFKKVHEKVKLQPETIVCDLVHPEYVPLESLEKLRKKWKRYLDIQQDILKDLTFGRLLRGIRSNSIKTVKYFLKTSWIFATKRHNRMPLSYEFYTGAYHVQLMGRLIQNYMRKISRNLSK